ncbi:MAG: hypothetical protein H8Z69_05590 [Nanohaloarchaea archaeon]|nr:hypothetical protein [Candidatus Nanohaloarchaea archaeon]
MPDESYSYDTSTTVPNDAGKVIIEAYGAQGESSSSANTDGATAPKTASGGNGGIIKVEYPVNGGETLYIRTEGGGNAGSTYVSSSKYVDNPGYVYGAGGGNAADVRLGGSSLYDRIVVAGGGGGGGSASTGADTSGYTSGGGAGGALQGEDANGSSPSGGGGGTQNSGGSAGKAGYHIELDGKSDGSSGSLGSGASGSSQGTDAFGGGGGGGYYGGGSGAAQYYFNTGSSTYWGRGGGGGSNYCDSSGNIIQNQRGGSTGSASVSLTWITPPNSPSSLSTSFNNGSVSLSWSSPGDWGGETGSYKIYRGNSSGNYSQIGTTSSTSFTDNNPLNGTNYYVVRATNSVGDSSYSNEATATTVTAPSSPSGISLTVNSNDQIAASWSSPSDWGGDQGNYRVQINRDGNGWVNPSGGNTTPGSGTTSASYGPNSDNSYNSQVGIDSSFRFRVRAENSAGSSGWTYSETVYTTPTAPKKPSVNRSDANTVEISWTSNTDLGTDGRTDIEYREDTGSGYNGWSNVETISASAKGTRRTRTYSVSSDGFMQEDARYQFRLAHYLYQDTDGDGNNTLWESPYVYADYGNQDNLYFEDDFESGDLSNWDSNNLAGDTGVKSGSGPADLTISGADSGSNYFYGEGVNSNEGTWIQKNLGDLSSGSDVLVRCAFATASLDSNTEDFGVKWYDGSSWRNLRHVGQEYNRQGWFEFHALVPPSYLSSDSRIRVGTTTQGGMYGGDYYAVDRVIVSDVLHEYTKPAAPSSVTVVGENASGTVDGKQTPTMTIDWTANQSHPMTFDKEWRKSSSSSWDNTEWGGGKPYKIPESNNPKLLHGEEYEIRVGGFYRQYRHGSRNNKWWSNWSSTITEVTPLPAPSGVSASVVANDQIDLSWNDNINNGNYHVQINRDGTGYVDPSGGTTLVSQNTSSSSYTPSSSGGSSKDYDANVGIDSTFSFRVRSETEHTNSSWNSSSKVYTRPVPPGNVTVNRPDAVTVEISWDNETNYYEGVDLYYRKDAGSGYGNWKKDTNYLSPVSSITVDTSKSWFEKNARYQFRIWYYQSYNDGSGNYWHSDFSYADYGNENNVYFEDDFSSGDDSAWTSSTYGVGGVVSSLSTDFSNGETSPQSGGYAVEFGDSGNLQKDLGDMSGESDVHVRVRVQTASNDVDSERGDVWWYDGSTWQNLKQFMWELDGQGWMEYHIPVPDSYLSTDNKIRIGRDEGGGADWVAFDKIIVSDILHEYTMPSAPTNLVSKSTGIDSLELSWTDNANFEDRYEIFYRQQGASTWTKDHNEPTNSESAVINGLPINTRFELRTREVVEQFRNGSVNSWWYHDNLHPNISTALAETLVNTPSANVKVPVFDLQDVQRDFMRTKTPNGIGALNFAPLNDADLDQIRVYTESYGTLGLKSETENN